MKAVDRYIFISEWGDQDTSREVDGDWVKYTDYADLEAKLKEAESIIRQFKRGWVEAGANENAVIALPKDRNPIRLITRVKNFPKALADTQEGE